LIQVGAIEGYCIHCIDPKLKSNIGEFEDVSKIEKFRMEDKDYDKRDDSFRKFRERQQKINPKFACYMGDVPLDY
jgi:tubulin-folding cofactor B